MDQIPALDSTFGAAFIGVILASVLYGVSCSQVIYYFKNCSEKDGPTTKALVVVTWGSDTVHQALICHTIYTYLVKGYFKPQQLGELVWSLLVEVIFNGITAFLVQSYFAVRIWKLSSRNWITILILAPFILGEFAAVIAYAVKSLSMTTFAQLATLKPLSMAVNALAVVGDVSITIMSCVLLNRVKSGFPSSNRKINLLIAFAVNTGMVTSICAIASLVSISVWPNTFIYIAFYFMLGRLYCNSLLATLNLRHAISSRGSGGSGVCLERLQTPGTPTTGSGNQNMAKMGSGLSPCPTPQRFKRRGGSMLLTDPIRIEVHRTVNQDPPPTPPESSKSDSWCDEDSVKKSYGTSQTV